jgi:tRNA nucleotidyltransferase/poly(A) polymerase
MILSLFALFLHIVYRLPNLMIAFDTSLIPPQKGVYLVGGSLRDTLLDKKPLDYDIVVKEDPLAYARKIAKHGSGRLVFMGPHDRRIIRVVRKNTMWDISAMNGSSIEEDLSHRDFTIDALAYDTAAQKLVDIFGGLDDLKNRCIRMVSNSIFRKDPLRLVRAYRLAATFKFRLDPLLESCIQRDAHLIRRPAGERIRDELFKIFSSQDSFAIVRQMKASGLLFELVPEIGALQGIHQNQHHAYDVLEHTFIALGALETLFNNLDVHFPALDAALNRHFDHRKKGLLKCALLLHDIGKPLCKTWDASGDIHFIGHEKTGAVLAEKIGRRLRFSNHETDTIVFIIRHHLRPLSLFMARQNQTLTPKGIARFFMKCEKNALDILLHAAADFLAKKETFEDRSTETFIAFVRNLVDHYFNQYLPLASATPLISGRDIIEELHLKPSPMFKIILSQVKEAHLAGNIASRNDALKLARSIATGRKA